MSVAAGSMSVAEAAGALGVGARWLADQARAGVVPHRRYGRRIRFTEADVVEIENGAARGAVASNPWGLTPRSAAHLRAAGS